MEANLFEEVIPRTLPVNGHDRYEYFLKYGFSNIQIQAVISFDQLLDYDTLRKAVRLSLDAEPVLGCRFVEDDKQAYWQRFEHLDNMPWFEFTIDANRQEAIERFLTRQFLVAGQQLNVRLIRTPDGDILCVKICHACSDAGGLKEYLQLLSAIYTKLEEDPQYKPKPNLQGRRDQKLYFEALGIDEPTALFNPQAHFVPPTWVFPYHSRELKQMRISMRRFTDRAYDRIMAYAKANQVTVNDIILTAFFRSMFELNKPPLGENMGVCVTIDLRQSFRAHPDQAICNLSVGMYPTVGRQAEEPFWGTLKRVSQTMEALKRGRAEMYDAVGLEVWEHLEYPEFVGQMQAVIQWVVESGKSHPLLSNMGVINPLIFGKTLANDAYIVTPILYPPGFMLGVSTYHKTITLEASFSEPAHHQEDVEALMDLMAKELRSL